MESERSLPLQKGLPLCLSPANNFESALSYSSHQPRFGRPNNILWNAHKSCVQLIIPCNQHSISHHQNTTFRQVYLRYKDRHAAFWVRTYIQTNLGTKISKSVMQAHILIGVKFMPDTNYGASVSIVRWLEPLSDIPLHPDIFASTVHSFDHRYSSIHLNPGINLNVMWGWTLTSTEFSSAVPCLSLTKTTFISHTPKSALNNFHSLYAALYWMNELLQVSVTQPYFWDNSS